MFEKEGLYEIACRIFQERYEKNGRSGMYTLGFMDGYNKAKEDADKMKSQFLELCNLKDMRIKELDKANEWHKPSEKLPEECSLVLAYLFEETEPTICEYVVSNQWECLPKRIVFCSNDQVRKWKEIVLPKESE